MSYILDALRKSEQQRKQEGVIPGLDTVPLSVEAPPPPSKERWVWLAVIVFLLVIMAALVWDRVMGSDPSGSAQSNDGSVPVATDSPPVSQTVPVDPYSDPSVPVSRMKAPPVPVESREPAMEGIVISPDNAHEYLSPRSPSQAEAQGSGMGANTHWRQLPRYSGLPAAAQQGVPPMSLTGHTFSSDPAYRSVVINGQRYREGDWVGSVQLERITEQGAVMVVNGRRFHERVMASWGQ